MGAWGYPGRHFTLVTITDGTCASWRTFVWRPVLWLMLLSWKQMGNREPTRLAIELSGSGRACRNRAPGLVASAICNQLTLLFPQWERNQLHRPGPKRRVQSPPGPQASLPLAGPTAQTLHFSSGSDLRLGVPSLRSLFPSVFRSDVRRIFLRYRSDRGIFMIRRGPLAIGVRLMLFRVLLHRLYVGRRGNTG